MDLRSNFGSRDAGSSSGLRHVGGYELSVGVDLSYGAVLRTGIMGGSGRSLRSGRPAAMRKKRPDGSAARHPQRALESGHPCAAKRARRVAPVPCAAVGLSASILVPLRRAMGLMIRTITLARARSAIALANIAYNMRRLVWLSRTRVATWAAS